MQYLFSLNCLLHDNFFSLRLQEFFFLIFQPSLKNQMVCPLERRQNDTETSINFKYVLLPILAMLCVNVDGLSLFLREIANGEEKANPSYYPLVIGAV